MKKPKGADKAAAPHAESPADAEAPAAEAALAEALEAAEAAESAAGGGRPANGAPPASELDALKREVAELGRTKQRLSRLYFSQVEENRKRAQKLHQILGSITAISSELDLDVVLQRVADTIHERLGFRVVLIRLREAGTHRLVARAFVGVDEEGRDQLKRDIVTLDEFQSWLKPECRVSASFFISHRHALNPQLQGHTSAVGPREEWEWHPEDMLLVPVHSRGGELTAYFSVDDPVDRLVPSRETVEMLEILASHAGVAIENARLVRQLEQHTLDLEAANRHMQEIHALKSEFLSTVSHELRTPLTAIRAYVDALLSARDGDMGADQVRRFLGIVNEEGHRLTRLIESMLDLNRFDTGAMQAARKPLDLAEVVEDAVALLKPVAETGQVALKVQIAGADTGMVADRDQMKQLVLHLGSNAIKFTPPRGAVTLRLSGNESDVVLEVEDTGVGIPDPQLENVFERFHPEGAVPARSGRGLGLAICKSIVEWHGGRISAESQPEQGSRFTVVLPRRSGPGVTMPPRPRPQGPADDVLRLAIEMVAEVMNARVVSLFAPDQGGELVMQAATGLDENAVKSSRLAPGHGVAGWVAKQRRPVCVSGPDAVHEAERGESGTGSFLSVPLEGPDGLLGVLSVTDPASGRPFGGEDCHLLLHLAERVATAWAEARTLERSEKNVEGTARAIRRVLDHVERGRRAAPDRAPLARRTARRLGLSEQEAGLISYAASIHDVGMSRLENGVTSSPNPLSDAEREAVERHPEVGAELLRPLEEMGAVRDIVLSHHEWWDGSGYPRGLAGESIPVGARILAVVDAWESMSVGRRHRPARSTADALAELKRLQGRQFDPAVVEAFELAWHELEKEEPRGGRAIAPAASETRG